MKIDGFAGVAPLFILDGASSHQCDTCTNLEPTITTSCDVTAALRTKGIAMAKAAIHVIAYDLVKKTAMPLAETGIPPPVLSGPQFSDEQFSEGKRDTPTSCGCPANALKLQRLLNLVNDEAPPLDEDGWVGPKTAAAIKAAQASVRALDASMRVCACRVRVPCACAVCARRVRVPCARAVCACRVRVPCACAVCACRVRVPCAVCRVRVPCACA